LNIGNGEGELLSILFGNISLLLTNGLPVKNGHKKHKKNIFSKRGLFLYRDEDFFYLSRENSFSTAGMNLFGGRGHHCCLVNKTNSLSPFSLQ
jgi:hypothetical protein